MSPAERAAWQNVGSSHAYETSELFAFVLQPTEETWEAAGDREFICSVYLESEELEGSVEGSER